MKRVVQSVSCMVFIWVLTGCGASQESVLQGTVKDVTPRVSGAGGTLLVKAVFDGPDVPNPGLVSIGLDETTPIVDERTGATRTTLASLTTGQTVRAEITGPVMETYPMHATVKRVVIVR